jgi:methylthioribulose-1-phosphate dehydratase
VRSERKYRFDASRQYPLSLLEQIRLERLCEVAQRLDTRLAIPATSSNFSLRSSTESFLISRSGKHKRDLNAGDFLLVDLDGAAKAAVAPKPSDETLLHALVYKHCPWVHCVLHCHAPELENIKPHLLRFDGHELLKALGARDHETPTSIQVYENNQDMHALAAQVEERQFQKNTAIAGPVLFVLAQHGIYCGGESVERAEAYLESVLHLLKHVGFTNSQPKPGAKQ